MALSTRSRPGAADQRQRHSGTGSVRQWRWLHQHRLRQRHRAITHASSTHHRPAVPTTCLLTPLGPSFGISKLTSTVRSQRQRTNDGLGHTTDPDRVHWIAHQRHRHASGRMAPALDRRFQSAIPPTTCSGSIHRTATSISGKSRTRSGQAASTSARILRLQLQSATAISITTARRDVLWYNPTNGDVDIWKIQNGQWAGSCRRRSASARRATGRPRRFQRRRHRPTCSGTTPSTNDAEVWMMQNGQWAAQRRHRHASSRLAADRQRRRRRRPHQRRRCGTIRPRATSMSGRSSNGHWAGSIDIGAHPAGYAPARFRRLQSRRRARISPGSTPPPVMSISG